MVPNITATASIYINDLQVLPVTTVQWNDLETLFGEKGACGGCWCMYWRLSQSTFQKQQGQKNKHDLKLLVETNTIPGLLAYIDNKPVGWISLGPREVYSRLEHSRILKRVDEQAVWSIVCFFVDKAYRRSGVTVQLLKSAIEYAKVHNARIIEGYPVDSKGKKQTDVFVYTGLASSFLKAGFKEVIRRSEKRPIMRYYV